MGLRLKNMGETYKNKRDKWRARQGSNLRPLPCEVRASTIIVGLFHYCRVCDSAAELSTNRLIGICGNESGWFSVTALLGPNELSFSDWGDGGIFNSTPEPADTVITVLPMREHRQTTRNLVDKVAHTNHLTPSILDGSLPPPTAHDLKPEYGHSRE